MQVTVNTPLVDFICHLIRILVSDRALLAFLACSGAVCWQARAERQVYRKCRSAGVVRIASFAEGLFSRVAWEYALSVPCPLPLPSGAIL